MLAADLNSTVKLEYNEQQLIENNNTLFINTHNSIVNIFNSQMNNSQIWPNPFNPFEPFPSGTTGLSFNTSMLSANTCIWSRKFANDGGVRKGYYWSDFGILFKDLNLEMDLSTLDTTYFNSKVPYLFSAEKTISGLLESTKNSYLKFSNMYYGTLDLQQTSNFKFNDFKFNSIKNLNFKLYASSISVDKQSLNTFNNINRLNLNFKDTFNSDIVLKFKNTNVYINDEFAANPFLKTYDLNYTQQFVNFIITEPQSLSTTVNQISIYKNIANTFKTIKVNSNLKFELSDALYGILFNHSHKNLLFQGNRDAFENFNTDKLAIDNVYPDRVNGAFFKNTLRRYERSNNSNITSWLCYWLLPKI